MKKLAYPCLILGCVIGFWEYSKEKPNIFIIFGVIVLFMFGMMQLSAKLPSKHSADQHENQEFKDENRE